MSKLQSLTLLFFCSEVTPLVLSRKMITLLLLSFFSLSQAESFDQAYSDLEHYRTIYISGRSEVGKMFLSCRQSLRTAEDTHQTFAISKHLTVN